MKDYEILAEKEIVGAHYFYNDDPSIDIDQLIERLKKAKRCNVTHLLFTFDNISVNMNYLAKKHETNTNQRKRYC